MNVEREIGNEAGDKNKKKLGRPSIGKEEERKRRKIIRDRKDRAEQKSEFKKNEMDSKGYRLLIEECTGVMKDRQITNIKDEIVIARQNFNKSMKEKVESLQDEKKTLIDLFIQYDIVKHDFIMTLERVKQNIRDETRNLKSMIKDGRKRMMKLISFFIKLQVTSLNYDLKVEIDLQNEESEQLEAEVKALKAEVKWLHKNKLEIVKLQSEERLKDDFKWRLEDENRRLRNGKVIMEDESIRLGFLNRLFECLKESVLTNPQIKNDPEKYPSTDETTTLNGSQILSDAYEVEARAQPEMQDQIALLLEQQLMNNEMDEISRSPGFIAQTEAYMRRLSDTMLEPNCEDLAPNMNMDHDQLHTSICTSQDVNNISQEVAMNVEHDKCYFCQRVEALMRKVNTEKSTVKNSDFKRLEEENKECGGSRVPPYFDKVARGLNRDITARSPVNDQLLVTQCAFFYAVIDEMHTKQLDDIDENVMLRWGFVIKDAMRLQLDVEFAQEHLEKIAHAYYSKEIANGKEELQTFLSKIFEEKAALVEKEKRYREKEGDLDAKMGSICWSGKAESFDGVPLSKGILA